MQGLGGTGPGLNRGATMSGNKAGAGQGTISGMLYLTGATSAATGSVTATADGWAYVYAFGAGGKGSDSNGSGTGGGGGAAYRKVQVRRGDTFSASAGKSTASGDGEASTVTLPNGSIVSAAGGISAFTSTPGVGGVGSGGDINRRGGDGVSGTNPGQNSPDIGGGTGGIAVGPRAGGGGAAGFGDHGPALIGGDGGGGSGSPVVPGGGGGANSSSGAAGRVVIIIVSAS